MIGLAISVIALVLLGSVLAMAEASISRLNRVRALALQAEGRRNAGLLYRIESQPTRYLNAVYLAVMFAQNGSAILVALIAERLFGNIGITLVSIAFTLAYFVLVEALSKSIAVLHSDRVALTLSPFVLFLGRALWLPTTLLVRLADLLLPKRDREAVSEADIRSMADVALEEEAIETRERDLIHSIFRFGDTIVREIITPRPDIVAVHASASIEQALDAFTQSGYSRLPVRGERLDDIHGFVHVKDALRASRNPEQRAETIRAVMQPIRFIPESRRVAEVLKDMQREHFHFAMVVDEYGAVSGLVSLEDLLEEIVGEIEDESDREEPPVQPLQSGKWRIRGRVNVDDLNRAVGAEFPRNGWDTAAGLLMGALGHPPQVGDQVDVAGFRLTTERVQGRRAVVILVERVEPASDEASSA